MNHCPDNSDQTMPGWSLLTRLGLPPSFMPSPKASPAGKSKPKAQTQAKAQAKAAAKPTSRSKVKPRAKARSTAEKMPVYSPPKSRRLTLGDCRLTILPSVKGLASERGLVEAAILKVKPRCLAVGISPGEIDGLRQLAVSGEKPPEFFLSQYEEIYHKGLAFLAAKQEDKVILPPPAFDGAVKLGVEKGLELEGIDLEEVAYTTAYIKHITRWQWLRQGMRLKKLKKRPWGSIVPSDFALEYDDALCALPGYAALERTREEAMAQRLLELAEEHDSILAIIELPRVKGIIERLKQARASADRKVSGVSKT